MNYTTYQPQFHQTGSAPRSFISPETNSFMRSGVEIAIGALLLFSPMFWLFIAEMIK